MYKLVIFSDKGKAVSVQFSTLRSALAAYESARDRGEMADVIDLSQVDSATYEKVVAL